MSKEETRISYKERKFFNNFKFEQFWYEQFLRSPPQSAIKLLQIRCREDPGFGGQGVYSTLFSKNVKGQTSPVSSRFVYLAKTNKRTGELTFFARYGSDKVTDTELGEGATMTFGWLRQVGNIKETRVLTVAGPAKVIPPDESNPYAQLVISPSHFELTQQKVNLLSKLENVQTFYSNLVDGVWTTTDIFKLEMILPPLEAFPVKN